MGKLDAFFVEYSQTYIVCYFTSQVLITCVATERFIAICYPLYQQMVGGKSCTRKIIIGSWIFGGNLGHLGGTISYLLACIVNFLMYANIIITLKRRSSHDLGTSEHNVQYEVNQVARLLITNGAVFFLCVFYTLATCTLK